MNNQELEILQGVCRLLARRFIDMAEHHTYPKKRSIEEYEIRLSTVGLCNIPLESASKRLRIAKKLEQSGLITLSQYRKGGTWSVKFTNLSLSQELYEMALKSVDGFDFQVGKYSYSLPQFSKTQKGFSESECLARYAFEILKVVDGVLSNA